MVQVNNVKISELPELSSPASDIILPVVSSETTSSITKRLLLGHINVRDYGVATTNTAAQNNTPVANAVSAAALAGAELFWPEGTYLTSASIPSFHSVRHRGPGAVGRGGGVFYVEPKNGQTNRLYVDPAGSTANDGLSSSEPMQTAAGLFSAMANYGPMLEGTWQGIFAAGTYVTSNASFSTPSRNLVTFKGPDPGGTTATPTAIFSGSSAGSSDFGMRSTGPGVQCLWQDLLFDGYDTSVNNICLLADYGSDLWTHNVHCTNSTGQGIYGEDCPVVRITGGIIDGCKQGILLNACNMVTVGYQHTLVTDGIVRNCTQAGIEWSRGTNGHCDLMSITSNAVGLDVMHASRVHLATNTFTSNTVAVRARSGGYYLDDTNTYTTNTENWQNMAGSGETDSNLWVSISERRAGYSVTSVTHTGTVAKTTLLSPYTIPQNFFISPSAAASKKKIRVRVHGEFITADVITVGIDFDSVVIATFNSASSANTRFILEAEVWADGNATQFKSATLTQSGQATQIAATSPAQNMANAARNINVTATLADVGDSVKVDRTEVWIAG